MCQRKLRPPLLNARAALAPLLPTCKDLQLGDILRVQVPFLSILICVYVRMVLMRLQHLLECFLRFRIIFLSKNFFVCTCEYTWYTWLKF